MKNKGFTLIELLAVIVILAIIALIATPIIINIINDSRENANKRSVELYGKAVEQAIAKAQLTEGEIQAGELKNVTLSNNKKLLDTVQYSGNKVECTTNTLYEDGKIYLAGCKVGNDTKDYTYGEEQEAQSQQLTQVCTLVEGTSKRVGAKYTCTVMDAVYFYVLENDPESEDISLIMDRNYTDGDGTNGTVPPKVFWCTDGSDDNRTCTNINDTYVPIIQKVFNTQGVIASFPTKEQIYNVNNNSDLRSTPWLYDNLSSDYNSDSAIHGYWTSSPDTSIDSSYCVNEYGVMDTSFSGDPSQVAISTRRGLRPVITISKSLLN